MSHQTSRREHCAQRRADLSWAPVERVLREVLDTPLDVEDRLSRAADASPSAATVRLLAAVADEPLSPRARVDFLVCVEKAQAWLASLTTRPLVEAVGTVDLPGVRDPLAGPSIALLEQDADREDIRVALRLSDPAVRSRINVARWLAGPLAATGRALAEGHLSWLQARALVEAAATVADGQASAFESAVLPRMMGRDLSFTRRVIRRARTS